VEDMKESHKELIITVQLHGDDDGDDYNETENTLSEIIRELGLCDFSLVCNNATNIFLLLDLFEFLYIRGNINFVWSKIKT